jgi:isoquinoline 1-oxidoreductase beta subunit
MTGKPTIERRDFLRVTAAAGGGLLISICLPSCQTSPPTPTATATAEARPTLDGPDQFSPAAYVRLGTDGSVTITVHRSEMGQSIRTSLAMILAEELDADWDNVRIEQADADTQHIYGDQHTGGSRSTDLFYLPFRRAGAIARDLLITAAAQVWGIDKSMCTTDRGDVIRQDTSERLAYGYLVPLAANLPVEANISVDLKRPEDFRIIGTPVQNPDGPAFVTGSASYGIDVQVPGMLFAVVARPPNIGGHLTDYDDTQSRLVPGVHGIVPLKDAVAVVADSTWSAMMGREALKLATVGGSAAGFDGQEEEARLMANLETEPEPNELIAYYVIPFYSHAPMEPMNCLVDARSDLCEVWVGTQDPQSVKYSVISQTGLSDDQVVVHVPFLGGGFGRRLDVNSPIPLVSEAVEVSQKVGAAVRLTWSREEDIQHDYYHPLSVTRARASLDQIERPRLTRQEARGVPTGAWRAVTNVPEAFARECFLDEYAYALDMDPLELRRELSRPGPPREVLDLAAEKAGWGSALPPGHGRGIAYHSTWGVTPVAQVAEVSVDATGHVRVHRVVCAVACGQPVNPDTVAAQMEGGIMFGLTAALKGSIQILGGLVQQSNFDDYPLLRLDEAPEVEVHILPSHDPPSGIGEMANPVIGPAVANAIFAATGKRIRRLPMSREAVLSG